MTDSGGNAIREKVRKFGLGLTLACIALSLPPFFLESRASSEYSNFVALASAFLSIALCVYILKYLGQDDFAIVGACLLATLLLFSFAQITATVMSLTGSAISLPDVPDFFWLLGYVPLIFICVSILGKSYEYLDQRKVLILSTAWIFVLLATLGPLIYGIEGSGYGRAAVATLLAYAFLSIFTIELLSLLLLLYGSGKILYYWLVITAGLLFFCIDILLFTYQSMLGLGIPAGLSDSLFILSFLILNAGFMVMIWSRTTMLHVEPAGRYKVNQLMLIYDNGLLIQHVKSSDVASEIDPTVVSAMLMSIKDFVADSLLSAKKGILDELKYGDMKIVFQKGRRVFLVAVVEGFVADAFKAKLKAMVSEMEAQYSKPLKDWDGDLGWFDGVEEKMQALILE
ncbi:MAG: hypothetical protein V1934_03540 [Methanobacteriota archaeon]